MIFRVPVGILSIVFGLSVCAMSAICVQSVGSVKVIGQDNMQHILVIDPGHGGDDGGAVGTSGCKESIINLDISLKLNCLSHLYGITTVMTRDSETITYPDIAKTVSERKNADQKARVTLIRDTPNVILYSIHQNYYPSSVPFGPQVLYGHNSESAMLGETVQANLIRYLCPQSRRVATEVEQKIYLMRNCDCPAVLIECGFLSNSTEEEMLQNPSYQKKIATVLTASYLQYIMQSE